MANVAGRFELGRHNRPATILRELEESRPPGALLRFVRLAALGSLRYARPPAAEAPTPPGEELRWRTRSNLLWQFARPEHGVHLSSWNLGAWRIKKPKYISPYNGEQFMI